MNKKCKVAGCSGEGVLDSKTGNRYLKRGYCNKHYRRLIRRGGVNTVVQVQGEGRKKHPLYATYKTMRRRCYSKAPSNVDRIYYLDRGIGICDRWMDIQHGFWNFVNDMGERPLHHTLDRIDGDKGYSPENCRWASATTQSRNRRNVHESNKSNRVDA